MIVIGSRIKSRYAKPGFSYGELFREVQRREELARSDGGEEFEGEEPVEGEVEPFPSPCTKKEDLLFELVSYDVMHRSPRVIYSTGRAIEVEDLDSGDVDVVREFKKVVSIAGVTSRGEVLVLEDPQMKDSPTMRFFTLEKDMISSHGLVLLEKEERATVFVKQLKPIGVV